MYNYLPMHIENLALNGLKLITPRIFCDDRGFFFESFHKERYACLATSFVQDNYSCSKQFVIRGMHFQKGQAKLVSVLQGKILDVVVDIRPNSATFKQWMAVELDDGTRQQLFVPDGFAHGFCALSSIAHVQYKVSTFYDPNLERGFFYADPEIGIQWPAVSWILSKRDQAAPLFREVIG
jgi:dTDP-4-dehydrorhamnose 3,5-epimerase